MIVDLKSEREKEEMNSSDLGAFSDVCSETDDISTVCTVINSSSKLMEGISASATDTSSPILSEGTGTEEKKDRVPIFKDPSFVHSNKSGQAAYKKTRVWKNLKQIISAERLLPWGPDDVTYATIEAPPSFKPAKKYSDLSGLPAKYTDPQTKIRFATCEEFSSIRMMPADLVVGYLALRKANAPVP